MIHVIISSSSSTLSTLFTANLRQQSPLFTSFLPARLCKFPCYHCWSYLSPFVSIYLHFLLCSADVSTPLFIIQECNSSLHTKYPRDKYVNIISISISQFNIILQFNTKMTTSKRITFLLNLFILKHLSLYMQLTSCLQSQHLQIKDKRCDHSWC